MSAGPTVTFMATDRHGNYRPLSPSERMRLYRARQRGENVPRGKPGPKPQQRASKQLGGASLEELIDEVSVRLAALPPLPDTPPINRNHELDRLLMDGTITTYGTDGPNGGITVTIEAYEDG